jgi:tape measure domain-containing protein
VSEFNIDLNLKSEQLDQVSTELSAALQKIIAATNNTSTKKQDINLDISKTFLPFNDAVKFAALSVSGLGKNVVSVSKELSNLKTKLAELSSTASSGKASGKGVLNVNANTKFDTTGLEFSLKGTKDIDLSKIDVDTSKVKVVLTNTDIKLDAQIDGKINVEPVNLKLSGLIQKELAKSLTVGAVSLEKVLNDQVKAALKQTNIDLVAGSIDLSASVKKLSDDLNLEILNAGADFNLAKAVTDLETKLNGLINQATSSVSDVSVAPVNLKISGLIQGKINDNLTVGDINLGSSFGAGLKKAITEAIRVEEISVSFDLQPSIDDLVQNLSVRISSAADSFNIINVVDELEQSLVKLINNAKPVKSKSKVEETRKSAVVIPEAIPVKLLVPRSVAVKGVLEPVDPIKVKIQTPEEVQVEADLTADFVEALSKVKVKLAANANKLITELDAFDVSATDITDVVEGFLSEVVFKFREALKVSDVSELSSIFKDVQTVAKIDLGSDLKQELTKLSTKISDQIVSSGGSFEISESIQKLNQAINNDVNSIEFDFASAFRSLNLKFQNSVESISFKIEPIELAVNALFGKIETALGQVETKGGSSVVSSAVDNTREKELIQRGLFQKVVPAFQQSRDLGEIAPGKISGATREGKARNALVEQKANAALTILSKVAGDVENLGRTEAEAIANLVGELENVFEDLTPATSEAKKLVSAVSARVNQLAEKSAILKNSLASERDSEFTPLSLSGDATAALRIRKPKENTKVTPNDAQIEGGSPAQIKKANQLVSKETEELAFDLKVLKQQISNPAIAAALNNFANLTEVTAFTLGKTVEELAQIDPGFLRNSLQQSLTAEGVKFTASQGLGFGQQDIAGTPAEGMTGIEGILNVLASFTTDFVQAQLGNTTENQDAFAQFGRAGKEFAEYVGQAGVELYNNPAAKAAAASFGDNLKKSATSAANIYRAAQRIEDATLGVFGIFGKAAKFSLQAVAAQITLGNLGLGSAGSFLGEGVSGLAGAAGSLAKANTDAFGAGLTIDVVTAGIKAAAPLIGLGIATGIATKTIDRAIPNNKPEITALESKLTSLGQDLAEISKATVKSEVKARLGVKEPISVTPPETKSEPDLVEVVKPPDVKKNEEVASKKAAEKPVEITPKPVEDSSPKAKSKGNKNPDAPEALIKEKPVQKQETNSTDSFESQLKVLKDSLTEAALVVRSAPSATNLKNFENKAKDGLAALRPAQSARGAEASAQRATLDAEIARNDLRLSALKKLTTQETKSPGGRAEVNRVSANVSDQLKLGDLKEAQTILNRTKTTVLNDNKEQETIVDPAILRTFDKLQLQIDDEALKQEVSKLTEEIKKSKLTGSADFTALTTAAEKISTSSSKGSGAASQDLLLSIKSLDKALTGVKTKDFKEALTIAGTQSKLGEFDNAKATLQNARSLANGELQNNQVSVAELAIDTSDLKSIFDKFLTQVTKLDLAGVSDKGISDLKISAAKFVNFPDLALKARNKIDGLQTKLDKNTPKPPDSFGLNFKSAQSELSIGQLEAAKSFLLVSESFAKGREELNKVVALFADIRVEEIKGKVKGITDQISELKLGGVTAEGIQKVKSQVDSVGDKDAESKLLLTLKSLEKSIPKEKKEKSEFGELISALKKEKALGKPLAAEDLSKITNLAVTRNQKAAVDQLVAVKEVKPARIVDEFPAQAKLVRSQVRNGNLQETDVEKLKTLAKTRNQAEELLSILKKIENISIGRAFVSFKKEAEGLLTSGNKVSKFQAARLEQSAEQFKGTSKGDAAVKIVSQLKDGLDPFKLLAQEIQNNLKNGKVSEPGKLDDLSRLARSNSDTATVRGLREETKQVQTGNDFSAFKDAVETFKNNNDKSAAAIASVKESAALFKGTDKETQANTISRRFQGKPADAFREELKLQELNKTNNKTVDSSKLNQLASTDIEKALVLKLESALDKANFDAVFKEFSQLVKSAINDVKRGNQNPETLNQINESASLFAGTPKETEAASQSLSLQSVIDADQNRKFKSAKTSVAQNLPDADKAIQFIKDLSESSSKLANQAKGFLVLKDSSTLLAGFTEEIIQVQRALKIKGANVPELQAKLSDIGDRFSGSAVGDNKAVESRLFSTVNQSIGLESGQQAADFTKGTQLVKLGKTEDARKIFEELANDATSIGRQAQIALNKLDEVFTGLTKGEEQLLRELTAKFSSLKATSKNTGDLSALKDLATKSSQQNQTIQGSDRTDLFKDRFNKIAQDVEAAANPKSPAEKDKDKPGRDIGLTDLKSGFDLIKGTLQSTAEGLKALASAASVTSINLAKLDLANKGTVGQTEKDFEFAKKQATATGIGEQSTLRDLAAFKLSIPGADQLDSNGGRVTQSVGAKEVEQILKGLQSAGTANQLSGDEQAGASNAVLQILSKGQVQSEELKRQLANFLPGTVSTFAQSQGITTAELEGRLKRGEVGIDALIGFSELLEKKFGKISQQDTPTKAVNKLTGNIQEVGIRASAPGGAVIQGGLGIVNPLLGGVKDSAASLTTAASGIGLIIGAKFAQEAATKIGATGQLGEVLKKTAGLFVLDPNSSIKEQAFAGKFSALGKVAGLTLGAGLLTSVASALTGAEGLDSLFAKSAKNLQFLLSGIKLPGFGKKGDDKDETGKAKDTLIADAFTQIAPAALLFGAALQGLIGVIETITARAAAAKALPPAALAVSKSIVTKAAEVTIPTVVNAKPSNLPINFPPVPSSFNKTTVVPTAVEKPGIGSKVSGAAGVVAGAAFGLLTNPLTAIIAPLVLALGTYGLSTVKFQSEFSDGIDKQLIELRANTAELRKKNGDTAGGFGKNQSEDKGAFGLNTVKRDQSDVIAISQQRDGVNRLNDASDFGLKTESNRLKKEIISGKGSEKGFLDIGVDNNERFTQVEKVISDRVGGKAASDKFFADDPSTDLFKQALEKAAEASEAIRENIAAAAKDTVLSAKDAADLKTNKSSLSSKESEIQTLLDAAPSKDNEVNKQRALDLTDAKTKATELRKAILDAEVSPARKRVITQEDTLKRVNENKATFDADLEKLTPEQKNTEAYRNRIKNFDKDIADAKAALKTAKDQLAEIDPAVKLAKAATVKENADILTDRSAQARSLDLTGKEKASIELRSTEGNDREQSVRSARTNTATVVSDLQTLEDKLNSARDFQASVKLAPLADDFDEKIKAANKEVLDLQLETEKKRTEIASSKLSERIAIEAKLSEEADRKRTKQERTLNTQEAKGQLSNTVDANPQFNLNNSRLSEASAIRQEDVSRKQVKDQETVVKQTVVGKEAQQDKLDDLKLASIQKSAARQAAVRSRREAEENRLLEVADISTNNRNRALANQNSLASRVQQTFSPADQVRSAIQTEKASGRNSEAARVDIEKQILTLSQTRFGREQQAQKLEDLKSSKLQKDTDLYLAQLARVRAEYELLSTVIANTRAVREALSSAKTQTAANNNEIKFQNKTGAIANDLAGTDTSARDNRARTEQLQANRRTQDGLDKISATGLASDLTTKLRKLGSPVDYAGAAKPALNATPVQLEKKISAVDTSLRELTLKQAKGDLSKVSVNDGVVSFKSNSIEGIQAYKEFLESFRSIAAKKEADNLAIFSSKKTEEKGAIERASNSQRNAEQAQIDTKVSRKTEETNRDGVRARQKDREVSLQNPIEDPLSASTRATVSVLKSEASQKKLADAVLAAESGKRVRTLTANRDQALVAGQGDEADKLGLEITAEIGKLNASLSSNNFGTLESGIDNIFAELKKQTSSGERIAELNQEQVIRLRSVFDLKKSLGLVEESDKEASSRDIGNRIDDSNTAIAKAKRDLNKESTPAKVIDNLKSLDDATKANPVLNSLAREALNVAETLAKSGKLTGSAISDIISSLDSLTISATEKATAIKFAADKIDRANDLEKNQSISDVRNSADALIEKQNTGRFSGIENSSIGNKNRRDKINTDFNLRIQAIDNEEFANRDNLTEEQKQVKFGSKREIAKNNRDLDLSEIKSESRKLAGDISEIITSNLKFDQFFKDIASDGDIGKAASRIGESLFDGLANYFSQKAQKSLNDVIGSFFENIFDSIFGIVKDKAKESINPVKTALKSIIPQIESYPQPSVALAPGQDLARMAAPKDIPQVESYPAPSVVVDPELVGKSIAENIPSRDTEGLSQAEGDLSVVPELKDNRPDSTPEILTEPYPQPFLDLGANGIGTPVPDAEYIPAPDTGKPFFFPDYLGEKLDTDNNDDYDWRNDLEGKAQPISNASGDWMNQEVQNIREATRNSEALEANTQALLSSESARAEIPGVPSQGGFDVPDISGDTSITSGLTGSNLAEDAAFSQNLPTTLGELTPALNTFKSGLEATKDPLLNLGSAILSAITASSGGSGGGGGGLGGLFSGLIGGLFGGGGGGSEVGSSVLGDIGGSFDLPSFADGTIREATNMPRTPGGKDLRERGADSRLAVLNAQELVVPAGLAQEFLDFKSTGGVASSLINNSNSTSNSTSNNTTNNSYTIQPDSFGRSISAQTVISDPTSNTRKRFNTNK